MIIFLYGPDQFRARQKLEELIAQYLKVRQSGLNLIYFDFEKDGLGDFMIKVASNSIFKEKKLVIIENAFLSKEASQDLLSFLQNCRQNKDFSHNNTLVFFEKEPDPRNPLFVYLKENAVCQEFWPLEPRFVKSWVKKEVKNRGGAISLPAIEELVRYCGNDLWRLSNEIKKLINFKQKRRIESLDVILLVKPKIEAGIFKTTDAIASGSRKAALKLIQQHFLAGDEPLYLLAMIGAHFRNLLIVKDLLGREKSFAQIAKITFLPLFAAKKYYFQAEKFTLAQLKKVYSRILDADLKIKTGKGNPRQEIEILVSRI